MSDDSGRTVHREVTDWREADEAARLRDEALARLLKMPPKPHEEMKLGKPQQRAVQSRSKRVDAGRPSEPTVSS